MSNPNKIEELTRGIPSYSYPIDLGSNGTPHVTEFVIFNYSKPKIQEFELKTPNSVIRMPIASKLSYGDALEYEEFSAQLLANLAAGTMGAKNVGDLLGTIAQVPADLLNKQLGDDAKLIAAQMGRSINPRNMNVFKTPKAREFQFDYSMISRNLQESKRIETIIRLFRRAAYPTLGNSGGLFNAPKIFTIRYLTVNGDEYQENNYLPKPLPSALVAINVDYNSMGEMAFHKESNAPVEVKFTLVFREMEIDTVESLDARYKDTDGTKF